MVTAWEKVSFYDVCEIKAPMVNPSEYPHLPHIGNENIEKQTGKLLPYNLAQDDHLISGKYLFSASDVLYAKIRPHFAKVAFPQFAGLCSADIYPLTCNHRILPAFFKYVLLTKEFTDFAVTLSMRSSGMPKVNRSELAQFEFFLPPLHEQERIASGLQDTDYQIDLLERIIAKKKAIKQGAMQELLTGKKRLPGFSGEWQYMELGKHGTLIRESINTQLFPCDYFWEYSMPAFDNGKTPVKQIGSDMHSNRTVIYGKVLLFNKLNVRQKRIWMINQCRNRAVCSSEFLPYQSDKINLELLAQILNTDEVTLQFVGMSTGTSNSQKRITPNDFLEYKVYLPIDEDEQSAIAEVLVCMGKEIEALEKKLAKYCQVKQGMMQQLLTGKIRLV